MDKIRLTGIIIAIVGGIFALFPDVVSQTGLLLLAVGMISAGIYLYVKNRNVGSSLTNFFAGVLGVAGLIILFNPGIILFVIGFSCVASGLGTLFAVRGSTRSVIYPIILVLLGIYAMFNTQGAGSAVILALGVILMIIGVMVAVKGKQIFASRVIHINRGGRQNFYTNKTEEVDEDVIDVSFTEKKED